MRKSEEGDDTAVLTENVPDNSRYLSLADIQQYRLDDEGVSTDTAVNQKRVEDSVEACLSKFLDRASVDPELPKLSRQQHIELLCRSLSYLSGNYECLDASRPWLCYWMLHALDVLGHTLPVERVDTIAAFLGRCQSADGGFGGGPGQLPHLAATYAAVSALASLGTEAAFQVVDRPGLRRFLRRCLNADGSFCMHDGGEVDIRGAYCAAAVARLTNVYEDSLFEKTPEWVSSCQTYEGGFSGTPGLEAHGGYTFCGLAALALLGHERLCDLDSLMRWVTNRQMPLEGGFSGRTQKLVDACYAYWQGAAFPIIHTLLAKEGSECLSRERWMFHQEALQHYLLHCCENAHGGFFDKPGKNRDFYHTCYALSGLSIAQNFHLGRQHHPRVVGHPDNQLELVHPIYNLVVAKAIAATKYWGELPVPTEADCSERCTAGAEGGDRTGASPERPGPGGVAEGGDRTGASSKDSPGPSGDSPGPSSPPQAAAP